MGLPEVTLALKDLLGDKLPLLQTTSIGKGYEAALRRKLDAIEALPPGLTGAPLAQELDELDDLHDDVGAASWHLTEAYLRHGALPAEQPAAAQRVRDALVPKLSELQRAYAVQAEAALSRSAALGAVQAELALLPVAGGGTLADWANTFLDAGRQIDGRLRERGDARVTADRKKAATLRTEAMGLVGRLRQAVRDEDR
jgi:hypothetical protein